MTNLKIYTDSFKIKLKKLHDETKSKIKGKTKKEIHKIWLSYGKKKIRLIENQREKVLSNNFKPHKKSDLKNGSFEVYKLKHKNRFIDNKKNIDEKIKLLVFKSKRKNEIKFIQPVIQYKSDLFEKNYPIFSDAFSINYLKKKYEENINFSPFDELLLKSQYRQTKSDYDIKNVMEVFIKVIYNETVNTNNKKK